MKLSIVATMYYSAPFLREFCQRVDSVALDQVKDDYEIILVNDGSPDNSLDIALELQKENNHIKVVDLARNFGHHAAIMAGLSFSKGEYVFLIDCDLEEQPEWLSIFRERILTSYADVIFAVQDKRVGNMFSNILGSTFWKILNTASHISIPQDPMTCRLMSRRYVDSLLNVGDRVLYLAGVFAWTGYNQDFILLKKTPRTNTSKSTYKLSRKLTQAVDSISSFSTAPLSAIFLLGFTTWIGSFSYGFTLFIKKILYPDLIISGFTSIMVSVWLLCGSIILFLGIIGLYIAKIFQEVKRRPLYIVRKTYMENTND